MEKRQEKRKLQVREKKEEPPRKFTVKDLAEAFADPNKCFKRFENIDPNNERFSLIQRNVYGVLPAERKFIMGKKNKPSKPP